MGKSKISIYLDDKVILVTGASRGIGAECAKVLAEAGAKVIVHYNHCEEAATEVVNTIQETGGEAFVLAADLRIKTEVLSLFSSIKKEFGRLDVLVNNAGIMAPNLLTMVTDKELDQMVDLNIKGALYCMQRATRMMLRQESGKIINLSSIIGRFGTPGHTAYAATKGAILAMTLSAAKELGTFGITVNCIAPGIIDTDLIKNIDEDTLAKITRQIALNRIGKPREIASVVLFLSSTLSDYISGQVIGVDGCYTI